MGYPSFGPKVEPAMMGEWRLWMHECGHVEMWKRGTAPADGGCDRCESGSDNASDWRPLFVEAVPHSADSGVSDSMQRAAGQDHPIGIDKMAAERKAILDGNQ